MLAYSSRESRRNWLRPICFWCCRSSEARSPRIHFATVARSAAVGCSSSSGGIRPDSISWRARNQAWPSDDTSRSSVHSPSSFTPASGFSPPWQPAQRDWTMPATFAGTLANAVPMHPAAQTITANGPTSLTLRIANLPGRSDGDCDEQSPTAFMIAFIMGRTPRLLNCRKRHLGSVRCRVCGGRERIHGSGEECPVRSPGRRTARPWMPRAFL